MERTDAMANLILEALASGCDVTITLRRRDDGRTGEMTLPLGWRDRFQQSGRMDWAEMDRAGSSVVAKNDGYFPW